MDNKSSEENSGVGDVSVAIKEKKTQIVNPNPISVQPKMENAHYSKVAYTHLSDKRKEKCSILASSKYPSATSNTRSQKRL